MIRFRIRVRVMGIEVQGYIIRVKSYKLELRVKVRI